MSFSHEFGSITTPSENPEREAMLERFDAVFEVFRSGIETHTTLPEMLRDFNVCIRSVTGKSVEDQIETRITDEDNLIGEMTLNGVAIATYQLYPGFFADFDTEKLKEMLV